MFDLSKIDRNSFLLGVIIAIIIMLIFYRTQKTEHMTNIIKLGNIGQEITVPVINGQNPTNKIVLRSDGLYDVDGNKNIIKITGNNASQMAIIKGNLIIVDKNQQVLWQSGAKTGQSLHIRWYSSRQHAHNKALALVDEHTNEVWTTTFVEQ
jgi:hypothetical protein